MIAAGEIGCQEDIRRRRSNRLGNSQATGPQRDETLESAPAAALAVGSTEGASRVETPVKSLQVPRQRRQQAMSGLAPLIVRSVRE